MCHKGQMLLLFVATCITAQKCTSQNKAIAVSNSEETKPYLFMNLKIVVHIITCYLYLKWFMLACKRIS